MPPHCDSLDGPVVIAARQSLDKQDVDIILPYVKKSGEGEVRKAFEKCSAARVLGEAAREVADSYFFETVVRIHREGEGASFDGLKPAGLDVGPVIPIAEHALESGSVDELEKLLTHIVSEQVHYRFDEVMHLKEHANHGVDHARAYVEAMLGLQVWSHKLYNCAKSSAHEGEHHHG
jgi:hypothetical protein